MKKARGKRCRRLGGVGGTSTTAAAAQKEETTGTRRGWKEGNSSNSSRKPMFRRGKKTEQNGEQIEQAQLAAGVMGRDGRESASGD